MSLLSLRKPMQEDPKRKDRNEDSISKRKKQKPKRFEISRTRLDYPILGGQGSTKTGTVSLTISRAIGKNSSFDLGPSNHFKQFSTSSAVSSISSSGNLFSSQSNTRVDDALASSKLNAPGYDGPVEPIPILGKRQKKRIRKHEKSLTKGSAWFDMAKVEITKEKKNDLEALKLRSAMDGVLHYKRNNITHTPKYFHVGTVVETSADFYSSRIPKKQRKNTLAQEFAADYEKGKSRW